MLIELMIVVVIVGIIVVVGYLLYQLMMVSINCGIVKVDLMSLVVVMECYYVIIFSYNGVVSGGGNIGVLVIYVIYFFLIEFVLDKKYMLIIFSVSIDGNSFELRVIFVSGIVQVGDGNLYIFSDGRKVWDKNNDGSLVVSEYCWLC